MRDKSNHQSISFLPILHRYQFIHQLKQLPFVQKIYLFGSRARGDYSQTSDIDLAIACPNATHDDWRNVMDIIDDADTLLKIDCVRWDEVDDSLKNKINEQGIIIYEK